MGSLRNIIGERIRYIRKSKGLSQEELANLASVHPTYIGQLERGEKNATIDSLQRITKALEVSLSDMFKHLDYMEKADESIEDSISVLFNSIIGLNKEKRGKLVEIVQNVIDWGGR